MEPSDKRADMSELRGEATDPVTLSRWRKCWRRIWKALKAFYAFAGVVRIVGGAVVVVGAELIVKVNAEKDVPPNFPEVYTVTLAVPAEATSALEICACN